MSGVVVFVYILHGRRETMTLIWACLHVLHVFASFFRCGEETFGNSWLDGEYMWVYLSVCGAYAVRMRSTLSANKWLGVYKCVAMQGTSRCLGSLDVPVSSLWCD